LTAVFFNIGSPTVTAPLTRVSAQLSDTDSKVVAGNTTLGYTDVGGEWAFAAGVGSQVSGYEYGIGAVGLDVFSPSDRFPGPDKDGQVPIGGISYGLTSFGDNLSTGNGHLGAGSSTPLIQYSMLFRLADLPVGFSLEQIEDVRFQYGTSLDEMSLTGVMNPEPGTLGILGMGIGSLLARRLRRRRSEPKGEHASSHN
jgi:hypothetical protein